MKSRLDKNKIKLPLLPLRGLAVFPGCAITLDAGRDRSVAAVEAAMSGDHRLLVVAQRDATVDHPALEDLYTVGAIATIRQIMPMPDQTLRLMLQGDIRALLVDVESGANYDEACAVSEAAAAEGQAADVEALAYMRSIVTLSRQVVKQRDMSMNEFLQSIEGEKRPGVLCDIVTSALISDLAAKQQVLECFDVRQRLEMTAQLLGREISLQMLEEKIQQRVREAMDRNNHEYYLREQIKAIQTELGDKDGTDVEDLRERLEKTPLNDEAREKAEKELERLSRMAPGTPEIGVSRTYVEWILDLPWGKTTPDNLDLKRARRVLEENHYGLEKVKERIIEYLAVLRMKNDMKGPILCFAGPPGVGKTSIVRAIAKAVGRQFVQMSLGGVRDEAEIRGHRRTYVGAIPGRVIAGIKQAGTMNPVFLFDEIDKMSSDFRGDPAAAMLEVLDAEQNSAFRDHYMEIPFDLSRVMFITTANNMENIPPALLDRLEIIEVPSYTEEEKLKIARKHLLPKQIEAHGLKPRSVRMNDRVLRTVIEGYTREAGVRELERTLARVARKAAVEMLEQKTEEITVTQDKLTAYLGQPRYTREPLEKENRVGVVNGLAYTSVGGEMLSVECAVLKGTGALQLTGKLGDVMQESAKAALSWVRAHCDPWGIPADFFKQNDIHIHVPEGAVPKDGPSAGVTLVTALVSTLTSIPVRQNVAMTGEITLRGRVLPIGGLKEKLMAAYRAGVRTVLIPRENLKDLEDVSPIVRERIDIRPVDDVAEVIRAALVCEPPVIADTPLELPLTAPQPAKPGMYKGV